MKARRKTDKKETTHTLDKECRELWSKCVIARDRCCQHTSEETGLTAHHIRSVGHAATRYDIENGLTLSWTKVHFLQKANPERFFDIVIGIIGWDEYNRLKTKSMMICKRNIADLRMERDRLRKELKRIQSDYGMIDWQDGDDDLPF